MTIRILVIDDELGRLSHKRLEFLNRWQLNSGSQFSRVVECSFITSQQHRADEIKNDASLAVAYVAQNPESWALVLLDMQFDDGPLLQGEPVGADPQFGLQIQEMLEQNFPALPVVQFTAQAQKDLQRQDGVYLSKLDGTVDDLKLLLAERGRISFDEKKLLLGIPEDTIVASDTMVKLYANVYRRARADTPLLLRGETGTGKEHLARYFHEISSHASGPLIAVQISTLPSNLYESQLFGHEKGAFTGADKSHVGLFSQADTGTIFLDEIGALPTELQAKLLRVIGQRTFRRLGGATDLNVRCGIVAATQDDLESNGFRKDLLSRFSTVVIPPLRERPQELLNLAEHFLIESQRRDKKRGMVLSNSAREALAHCVFPDNARGVRRAVETAVLQLSSNSVIQPKHLKLGDGEDGDSSMFPPPAANGGAVAIVGVLNSPNTYSPSPDARKVLRLGDLLPDLRVASVPTGADALRGVLTDFDAVVAEIKQELAFAALLCCRHPVSGKLKVQPAMQLITNNPALSPMNAKRKLNELLGRNQAGAIDIAELEIQLKTWEANRPKGGEPGGEG
jgi:CheY-like chemotaxis protein